MKRLPMGAFAALLALAFLFRLGYGLSMPFWLEDERQVYLIGLQSFATGHWPYFGADVVWTGGQIPGALLGWLIRLPLAVWPAPESPFVLLNLLSFGALALFAWYLTRRLPGVPRWLVWSTLLTLPWTLNFSTHVVNPSYVLPGAIVFFLGFFEGLPALRRGILPLPLAWACMGAGLLFVMQIHLSWVLLPPYVAAAALGLWLRGPSDSRLVRGRELFASAAACLGGAAVIGSLLAPTLLRHGFGSGAVDDAVALSPQSPFGLVTTTARVLSFASFEVNRFLGISTAERAMVLWRQPWLVPFVLTVLLAGLLQPLWMLLTTFRRGGAGSSDWTAVRALTAATVVLVYASYFWSVRGQQAHSFYVVFPVAALFAFTCWQVSAGPARPSTRRWERIAAVVIGAGLVTHAGLAIDRWPRQSLYADRALVAAAVADRNDRYLGFRRDTTVATPDRAPLPSDRMADPAAFLAARAETDLRLTSVSWAPVLGAISRFSVVVDNVGRAAWLDIRYATTYVDAGGRVLETREGVIKRIVEPGESGVWPDVVDGQVPAGAAGATLALTGAERAIPGRR